MLKCKLFVQIFMQGFCVLFSCIFVHVFMQRQCIKKSVREVFMRDFHAMIKCKLFVQISIWSFQADFCASLHGGYSSRVFFCGVFMQGFCANFQVESSCKLCVF